jgi:hypothetical protein
MRPLLSLSNSEPETVVCALAGLLLVDMHQWDSAEGRRLPGLMESGMLYQRERRDTWRDLFSTFAVFSFDCEDASTVYAAEGRTRGNHPFIEVYAVRVTPRLIHIYNGDGKGKFFDVSRERGMNVPPSVDLPSMYRRGVKCPL